MSKKTKKRIFEILETASGGDSASKFFDIFIIILISLNVIAVILETVKVLSINYLYYFRLFEVLSVAVFSIEYLCRLWSCTINKTLTNPVKGRIKFALTPLAIVDLLAILPFYLPMIIPIDLRFIRALRLMRLFRLFKIGRYSESLKTLGSVLKAKREELFITVFAVLILLVIASSMMYYVEKESQPEVFSSIPSAMWWGVATLTTVGYGDVYPVTAIGKFLGAIIAILGIGIFALPAGILASGLIEVIQKEKSEQRICPHCGKTLGQIGNLKDNLQK